MRTRGACAGVRACVRACVRAREYAHAHVCARACVGVRAQAVHANRCATQPGTSAAPLSAERPSIARRCGLQPLGGFHADLNETYLVGNCDEASKKLV